MSRVLVTGASGFLGGHCVTALRERGLEVHAVSSRPRARSGDGAHWHQADLLDPAAVERVMEAARPSHLLHLAWFVVPGRYLAAVDNFRWVEATLRLLDAFARVGGGRAVGAGTCFEYDSRYGACVERLTPLAPNSIYGQCKQAAGGLMESFGHATGVSTAWGRIFFLYGENEAPERLVPSVVTRLLRGEPAPCSHGTQVRDFLHVEDVARAFAALLLSGVEGPVNVGSGEPVRVRDIVTRIGCQIGRPELIRLGALAPRPEPALLIADVARLTDEVGWRPTIDLDEGLDRVIAWWRAELRA